MVWCSKENMQQFAKYAGIFICIILIICIIIGIIRRYQYMTKYEPLFINSYESFPYTSIFNLTDNINNTDKFNYDIQPSKNNISFSLSFWLYIYNYLFL